MSSLDYNESCMDVAERGLEEVGLELPNGADTQFIWSSVINLALYFVN